jgi:putative transposase
MVPPEAPNRRWSLDFVSDALDNGRRFRILAVIDDFTREGVALVIDTSLPGVRVGRELNRIAQFRDRLAVITQRQWHGPDVARDLTLAGGARGAVTLHRAR